MSAFSQASHLLGQEVLASVPSFMWWSHKASPVQSKVVLGCTNTHTHTHTHTDIGQQYIYITIFLNDKASYKCK